MRATGSTSVQELIRPRRKQNDWNIPVFAADGEARQRHKVKLQLAEGVA
jgi:hypothetical protein